MANITVQEMIDFLSKLEDKDKLFVCNDMDGNAFYVREIRYAHPDTTEFNLVNLDDDELEEGKEIDPIYNNGFIGLSIDLL